LVILKQTIPIIGSGAAGYMLHVDLNLIDNPSLIWLSWLSGFDFAFIIFYGVLKGISNSYSESARIDGANEFFIFFRVVLPLMIPVIIANAITSAMGIWNNYSISMLYLRAYPTLGYGMYILNDQIFLLEGGRPVYFACAIVSALPMVIIYASNINLLLKNMSVGGLKG
jgi:ABC-type glycerol-3-phosphate transport system permease component